MREVLEKNSVLLKGLVVRSVDQESGTLKGEKRTNFFSTFLCLSHVFSLSPELMITQQNNSLCSGICFSLLWFQIGKRVLQGCILSPCLFNLYAEYIMRNAGLEEAQAESRLPGEI